MKNIKKKKGPLFQINNRQKKLTINLNQIKSAFDNNPDLFHPPPEEVGVVIVSDKTIRKLNKEFLNKDSTTDIISFKLSQRYGEKVISAETAFQNSRLYGKSLENEIIYLIIHGYLHLKNYKDYKPADKVQMFKIQDSIFRSITGKDGDEPT